MGSRSKGVIQTPINRRVIEGAEHLVGAFLSLVLVAVIAAAYFSIVQPRVERPGRPTAVTAAPEVLGTTMTTAAGVIAPPTTITAAPAVIPTCDVPAPEAADGTMAVRIAYPCPGTSRPGTHWVTRRVARSDLVLTATVGEMVHGPTAAEQDAGFRSYWSQTDDDVLQQLAMSNGVVYVDLMPMPGGIPESPAEGVEWLSATAGTVFQFDTVRALELRLDGDCDAFWQSIGGTDCVRLQRTNWSRQLASWREATSGPPETRG